MGLGWVRHRPSSQQRKYTTAKPLTEQFIWYKRRYKKGKLCGAGSPPSHYDAAVGFPGNS
jgi:hypothetical protein